MGIFTGKADCERIEAERPYAERDLPATVYQMLTRTCERVPESLAIGFQLFAEPRSRAFTLTWREFHGRVTETANLFRDLGIGPADTVAYLLPNCVEAPVVLVAGATAGIVCPINPLLEPEHIAALLRESGAKVLVTLRAFPKTDIAQKAAEAVRLAPDVHTVLEIDLARYLPLGKRLAVALIRPRVRTEHHAKVLDFEAETSARRHDRLGFAEEGGDRIAARFHTGGTTGMPNRAQHRFSGMI